MTRFFLYLYRFFKEHKLVFYSFLAISTLIFGIFASKVSFEENILELLPHTPNSKECAVAFGNIKVKDKVFLEIRSLAEDETEPAELTAAMDGFVAVLMENDRDSLIGNCLYGFDTDDMMNLIYYAMDALPCHLPEDVYPLIDSLATEETIDAIMSGEYIPELPSTGGLTIVNGHLMSPDSTLALAFIAPSFPSIDTKSGGHLEELLSSSVEQFMASHPGFDVLYHGATIEGTFNSLRIKSDLFWTVGLSLLLICLLICICFKNKSTIFFLILPVLYGTLFSLACMYWIKDSMSLIAMGIGAIVLGVAISYCLHVLTHHKFVSSVEDVIREQTRPVILGCLTTIGAFAGLLLTSSELLKDFGLFASFAMIGTTFFSLAILPQFFTEGEQEKNEKAFEFINKVNSYPLDKNKPVVILMLAVIAVCIAFSGKIKFDSDLSNIGYREPKVVKSEGLYNSKAAGSDFSMYYAAHADNLDSAIVYSRVLTKKLDSLKMTGLIRGYSGGEFLLVPFEEQQKNIARWKEYWTEEKVEKVYALLTKEAEKYSWNTPEFNIPETFRLMAEADYSTHSIYEEGILPESLMCNFLEQNDDGWLVFTNVHFDRTNLKKVGDELTSCGHTIVLDPFYYTGDMVEIIHNDFNRVLLVSSLFVFLVLLISLRSVILSVIAFLPMALSWYIVQGAMVIFGMQFNLVNIMISTFVFGIGVDYSIFVMEGLISKAKYKSYRLLVCHKAAIFFSALTLLIVVSSLLFAKHPAISSIGVSTIIGMASTIFITYALQPLLFKIVMKSDRLRKLSFHEK